MSLLYIQHDHYHCAAAPYIPTQFLSTKFLGFRINKYELSTKSLLFSVFVFESFYCLIISYFQTFGSNFAFSAILESKTFCKQTRK